MMKTIYKISICAGLLAAAVSCSKGDETVSDGFGEGISLTFVTGAGSDVQVKGTPTAGDNTYNENLLNSVYYFLYPKGVTSETPAVSGFKTGLSETGSYLVKIPVSTNTVVEKLFKTSDECSLFAVANPPSDIVSSLEGTPTLSQLRSMVVLSSLKEVPQDNFVMVYDSTVKASSLVEKIAVDATVEMKHLAAKFTIGAIVIPSLTQGTDTYTPDGLSVKLCNGINRTTLGGWNKDEVEKDDYFDTDFKAMTSNGSVTIESETFQKYTLSSPVYSYPMEWEFNSETEPYLMYELNWKITDKDGNTSWKPLYYKLTLGRRSIMLNEWYDISGKLTVLGSLFPEEPTEIYYYMDYLVKGWKNALSDNGVNTPATIKDTRYLAVSQSEWTLNNKNEVTIPFSSSHPCQVVNKSIKTTSYSNGTANTNANPHYTSVTYDLSRSNEITVSHQIYNTLGSGMDCAPIIIEFDLQHTDDDSFTEHVKIIQNPAIMIETQANSGGGTGATNDYNYTRVNNANGNTGNWQQIQGTNTGGVTASNGSIYLTVITVSQFSDSSLGFILGDPRNPKIDNLDLSPTTPDDIDWNDPDPVSVTAKYKNVSRQIKYYHPTIDDGSRDNYVSPCFRVNSASCRRGGNDSYVNSKQRCAAYQEDGYPAGRWRLPTKAECQLIQTLSSNNLIPSIFIYGNSYYYHYAGGWFRGNASAPTDYNSFSNPSYSTTTTSTGSGAGAARCVYDEWYWSQVDAKMGWTNSSKSFTWGDVPDDFVIPTTE